VPTRRRAPAGPWGNRPLRRFSPRPRGSARPRGRVRACRAAARRPPRGRIEPRLGAPGLFRTDPPWDQTRDANGYGARARARRALRQRGGAPAALVAPATGDRKEFAIVEPTSHHRMELGLHNPGLPFDARFREAVSSARAASRTASRSRRTSRSTTSSLRARAGVRARARGRASVAPRVPQRRVRPGGSDPWSVLR
jgi:hypothetical protein